MKKRTLLLGSTALLIVTLFGTGLVYASPSGDHGKSGQSHGAGACVVTTPTPTPTPTGTPTPTPTSRIVAMSFCEPRSW